MLWTYNRGKRRTSYEVCQSPDGAGYELKRRHEDGHEECERFQSLDLLNQRITKIEMDLINGGWILVGGKTQ